jgi:hypothetical protein
MGADADDGALVAQALAGADHVGAQVSQIAAGLDGSFVVPDG